MRRILGAFVVLAAVSARLTPAKAISCSITDGYRTETLLISADAEQTNESVGPAIQSAMKLAVSTANPNGNVREQLDLKGRKDYDRLEKIIKQSLRRSFAENQIQRDADMVVELFAIANNLQSGIVQHFSNEKVLLLNLLIMRKLLSLDPPVSQDRGDSCSLDSALARARSEVHNNIKRINIRSDAEELVKLKEKYHLALSENLKPDMTVGSDPVKLQAIQGHIDKAMGLVTLEVDLEHIRSFWRMCNRVYKAHLLMSQAEAFDSLEVAVNPTTSDDRYLLLVWDDVGKNTSSPEMDAARAFSRSFR